MTFDPALSAMMAEPWSNNACRGYVIYAMENCGFSSEDIRRVVGELHYIFDFKTLEEAKPEIAELAAQHPEVQPFVDFFARSTRGLIR